MSSTDSITAPNSPMPHSPVWPLVGLGALLTWAYLPMLRVFADKWLHDPQYSHGFLVPIFSAYLLRRAWQTGPVTWNPMPALGFGLLVLVLGLRVVAGSIL